MAEQPESLLVDLESEPLRTIIGNGKTFRPKQEKAQIRVAEPGQYGDITVPENNASLHTFDKNKVLEVKEPGLDTTYAITVENLYYHAGDEVIQNFEKQESKLPPEAWQEHDINSKVFATLNPYDKPIHFDDGVNKGSGDKDCYIIVTSGHQVTTMTQEELESKFYPTENEQTIFTSPERNPECLRMLEHRGTLPYAVQQPDGSSVQVEVQRGGFADNTKVLVFADENNELNMKFLEEGTSVYRTEYGEMGIVPNEQVDTWQKLDSDKTPIRMHQQDNLLRQAVSDKIKNEELVHYTLVETDAESKNDLFIKREQDMAVMSNPFQYKNRSIEILNDQGEVQSTTGKKGVLIVSPRGNITAMPQYQFENLEAKKLPTSKNSSVELISTYRLDNQKQEIAKEKQAKEAPSAPKQPKQKQKSADGPEMDF